MTLSAGTYLSEKFLEHSDEDVCEKVNEKLQEYIVALGGLCSKHEAAQLMCQSLTNMFTVRKKKGKQYDNLTTGTTCW